MKAIGITCGIGSMLVGARAAGFEVVGNVEWRRYYHKVDKSGNNTFRHNFPGAFLVNNWDSLSAEQKESIVGKIDIALGHPECGSYSQLNMNRASQVTNPGDIPLFIDLVSKIKPRFFVMDDLPMAFCAVPMSEYAAKLPEYDLFPEMISNCHYGNIQKNRKRMFMLGALKTEKFVFIPGEFQHDLTMEKVMGDILGKEGQGIPNHEIHTLRGTTSRGRHLRHREDQPTWAEIQEYFASQPEGRILQYHGPEGEMMNRPGFRKAHWEGHSGVLTGQNPDVHPVKNLPLTIRERARIQGFPDSFEFIGAVINEDGTWDHEKNNPLVKQTGKAMPIQFCTYISKLIYNHINWLDTPEITAQRFLPDNDYVKSAKEWFCENVGYSDQGKACQFCHSNKTCEGPTPIMEEVKDENI
jgi:DNA (cytosine-5)-methyltransferase 1